MLSNLSALSMVVTFQHTTYNWSSSVAWCKYFTWWRPVMLCNIPCWAWLPQHTAVTAGSIKPDGLARITHCLLHVLLLGEPPQHGTASANNNLTVFNQQKVSGADSICPSMLLIISHSTLVGLWFDTAAPLPLVYPSSASFSSTVACAHGFYALACI